MNTLDTLKNALAFDTLCVAPQYQNQYSHYYQLYHEALSEQRTCERFSMRSRQLEMYINEIVERIQILVSKA